MFLMSRNGVVDTADAVAEHIEATVTLAIRWHLHFALRGMDNGAFTAVCLATVATLQHQQDLPTQHEFVQTGGFVCD